MNFQPISIAELRTITARGRHHILDALGTKPMYQRLIPTPPPPSPEVRKHINDLILGINPDTLSPQEGAVIDLMLDAIEREQWREAARHMETYRTVVSRPLRPQGETAEEILGHIAVARGRRGENPFSVRDWRPSQTD
ncbi:MAG: hypothetical protein VKJ04_07595 [Vampirovibrionales bacterium]|nr:hypothetical protein [Vampirovibrionales bacterium]